MVASLNLNVQSNYSPVLPAHADLRGHDFFCGFGGFTIACHQVQGLKLSITHAVNHNPTCIRVHGDNHPDTEHLCVDMTNERQFDPSYLPKADFAIFSPECKYHGNTTGVKELKDWSSTNVHQLVLALWDDEETTLKERNRRWGAMSDKEKEKALYQAERSRLTMGQVIRMIEYHKYYFAVVENICEVVKWTHYPAWAASIRGLGYKMQELFLNSQFFGVPQSRDRYYCLIYRNELPDPDLNWTPPAHCPRCNLHVHAIQVWKNKARQGKYRAQYIYACPSCSKEVFPYVRGAESIIDWSLPIYTVGQRKDPAFRKQTRCREIKAPTRKRIADGLRRSSRLLVATDYSQASSSGKVRQIESPLFTQTSRQTQALVVFPEQVQPFISTLRGNTKDRVTQNTSASDPLSTLTTVNHHVLVKPPSRGQILSYYSRDNTCSAVENPLSTVTPEPRHALIVPPPAFATNAQVLTYHGNESWHPIAAPLTTQTTRERHALVLPSGEELNLDDPEQMERAVDECGMRMLDVHEARGGMAFPENIKLTNNRRLDFFGLGQAITPPVCTWLLEKALDTWKRDYF